MTDMVKKAIEAEIKYIDEMEYGEADTTARILQKLGFNDLSFEELFDVEDGVYDAVEKTRDYHLDKSEHEEKCEGLPFNLNFVKVKK